MKSWSLRGGFCYCGERGGTTGADDSPVIMGALALDFFNSCFLSCLTQRNKPTKPAKAEIAVAAPDREWPFAIR